MAQYAAETSVSVEKSRLEIEATLKRYKADRFMYASEGSLAIIGFTIAGRMIRFRLTLPDRNNREFTHHSRGMRDFDTAEKAWEQACRQRWRALALVIKAKLEAVSAGITTIEEEFLSHTLMPDGRTVGEWTAPDIKQAYLTGEMPTSLLLTAPSRSQG